ncbi:MAG: FecR family protein [Acidobacteriota bacterium]
MDEREPRFDAAPPEGDGDDEAMGARIAAAGPRSPILPEALAALQETARAALGLAKTPAEASAPRVRPIGRRWRLAAAAAVFLAIGFGWFTFRTLAPSRAMPVAEVEAATGPLELEIGKGYWRSVRVGERLSKDARLRTGSGSRASLRLTQGAIVRLDAESQVWFLGAAVVGLERGGIYADTGTAKPTGPALEVKTPLCTVRHLGTQFEVRWIDAVPSALRVRVREGSVEVEGEGRTERAAAGEELSVLRGGGVTRARIAGFGADWEWTMDAAGRLEIEGRDLGQLLDRVGRETGWQVRFADPEIESSARRIVLHGGVGALRPDQAAFAILAGAGFEGKLDQGVLVVRLKTPS